MGNFLGLENLLKDPELKGIADKERNMVVNNDSVKNLIEEIKVN